MTFAIIRGSSGRRHEVDFGDAKVAVEVSMSDSVVQITAEATQDVAPSHKRRFAMLSVPREQLMAALSEHVRKRREKGETIRPKLVIDDEQGGPPSSA